VRRSLLGVGDQPLPSLPDSPTVSRDSSKGFRFAWRAPGSATVTDVDRTTVMVLSAPTELARVLPPPGVARPPDFPPDSPDLNARDAELFPRYRLKKTLREGAAAHMMPSCNSSCAQRKRSKMFQLTSESWPVTMVLRQYVIEPKKGEDSLLMR